MAGRPSVLVPLAIAADDHQRANALLLTGVGAAQVLPEKGLTAERLADTLQAMIAEPGGLARSAASARAAAKPDAAERLADLVETTAR